MRQIEEPSHVGVFTDSDHAGCLRTSKTLHHPNYFMVPTCEVPVAPHKRSSL